MTSALYTSLSALLIFWLSVNVIKLRRRHKIIYGDGGNEALQIAMAAQSNAIEYIPIALLLLFALEHSGANTWLIHVSGIALLTGRLIHARGLLSKKLKRRVLGMKITLYTIIGLAIANIILFSYDQMLAP